jgi:hypothetical protein
VNASVTLERTAQACPPGSGHRSLVDDDGQRFCLGADRSGAGDVVFEGSQILDRQGPGSIRAPLLYLVAFPVPATDMEEFDRWYATEHLDLLSRHPAWRRCQLFAGNGEGGVTRLAAHEWLDRSPQGSREQAAARATPWRAALAARPWFGLATRLLLHDADDTRSPGT